MTRAERIRKIMAGGEAMTAMDLADLMKVRDYDGLARIRATLQNLQARGVVERVEQEPRYRLTVAVRETVQQRLWKALVARGAKGVTIKEAAMLAGAGLDYTKRYLRWLEQSGWARNIATGVQEARKVYRVQPGKEQEPAPGWCRRHEDRKRRQQATA